MTTAICAAANQPGVTVFTPMGEAGHCLSPPISPLSAPAIGKSGGISGARMREIGSLPIAMTSPRQARATTSARFRSHREVGDRIAERSTQIIQEFRDHLPVLA
jgi:hypothetical protein